MKIDTNSWEYLWTPDKFTDKQRTMLLSLTIPMCQNRVRFFVELTDASGQNNECKFRNELFAAPSPSQVRMLQDVQRELPKTEFTSARNSLDITDNSLAITDSIYH